MFQKALVNIFNESSNVTGKKMGGERQTYGVKIDQMFDREYLLPILLISKFNGLVQNMNWEVLSCTSGQAFETNSRIEKKKIREIA